MTETKPLATGKPKVVLPAKSAAPAAEPAVAAPVVAAQPAPPVAPPGYVFNAVTNAFDPIPEVAPERPAPPPGFAYDEAGALVAVQVQPAAPAPVAAPVAAPVVEQPPPVAPPVAAPIPAPEPAVVGEKGDVAVTGFSSDAVKSTQVDFYKGKKGKTDRLSFPNANVKFTDVHFMDGYFRCQSKPGEIAECCQQLGPPSQRCGAIVMKYNTDRNGTPKAPLSYDIQPWVFNADKFQQIKAFNDDFPVSSNDIKVTCTEDVYQRLNITPAKGQLWRVDEATVKLVEAETEALWARLDRYLGRVISRSDMLERFGLLVVAEAEETPESVTFGEATNV